MVGWPLLARALTLNFNTSFLFSRRSRQAHTLLTAHGIDVRLTSEDVAYLETASSTLVFYARRADDAQLGLAAFIPCLTSRCPLLQSSRAPSRTPCRRLICSGGSWSSSGASFSRTTSGSKSSRRPCGRRALPSPFGHVCPQAQATHPRT